jgi:hypothetical protein
MLSHRAPYLADVLADSRPPAIPTLLDCRNGVKREGSGKTTRHFLTTETSERERASVGDARSML